MKTKSRKKKSLVVWMHQYLLDDYKNTIIDIDRGWWACKEKPKNNEPFKKVKLTIEEL
jgi:hypothetical protein